MTRRLEHFVVGRNENINELGKLNLSPSVVVSKTVL